MRYAARCVWGRGGPPMILCDIVTPRWRFSMRPTYMQASRRLGRCFCAACLLAGWLARSDPSWLRQSPARRPICRCCAGICVYLTSRTALNWSEVIRVDDGRRTLRSRCSSRAVVLETESAVVNRTCWSVLSVTVTCRQWLGMSPHCRPVGSSVYGGVERPLPAGMDRLQAVGDDRWQCLWGARVPVLLATSQAYDSPATGARRRRTETKTIQSNTGDHPLELRQKPQGRTQRHITFPADLMSALSDWLSPSSHRIFNANFIFQSFGMERHHTRLLSTAHLIPFQPLHSVGVQVELYTWAERGGGWSTTCLFSFPHHSLTGVGYGRLKVLFGRLVKRWYICMPRRR